MEHLETVFVQLANYKITFISIMMSARNTGNGAIARMDRKSEVFKLSQ